VRTCCFARLYSVQYTVQWNSSISETVRNRTHEHIHFLLRMTDNMASRNIDFSSWDILYILATDSLIPRSWILLEKPSVAQLLKNFPKFNGTQNFITVFTRARHLSLSGDICIQSIPPNPISVRSILRLLSHLGLVFLVVSFLFMVFALKPYMHYYSPSCVLHFLPINTSWTWSLYFAKNTSYEAPHTHSYMHFRFHKKLPSSEILQSNSAF
jgi:hypothetical protein